MAQAARRCGSHPHVHDVLREARPAPAHSTQRPPTIGCSVCERAAHGCTLRLQLCDTCKVSRANFATSRPNSCTLQSAARRAEPATAAVPDSPVTMNAVCARVLRALPALLACFLSLLACGRTRLGASLSWHRRSHRPGTTCALRRTCSQRRAQSQHTQHGRSTRLRSGRVHRESDRHLPTWPGRWRRRLRIYRHAEAAAPAAGATRPRAQHGQRMRTGCNGREADTCTVSAR